MQKELMLAIILGSTLGLGVAFGLWKINSKNSPIDNISDSNITSPTPHQKTNIDNLKDNKNFATNSDFFELNSKTDPNIFVLSISKNFKYITKSDSNGNFSIKHELDAGPNKIHIIFIHNENNFTQETYSIVYSTEVDQNISDLYLGSITDISENTIQVRKDNGDILQTTFDANTNIISIIKTSKEIESTDLAIGDYIYAIGSLDEKNILIAKRILVGSFIEDKVFEVKTTNINDEKINFDNLEDIFLYSEAGVKSIKLKDIDDEKNVIVIGEKNDDTINANTIILE